MNNVANNPIHNRGVAAADQTANSANANSRSRGVLSSVGAFLSSALHGQIVRRSPADAGRPLMPRRDELGNLLPTDMQLILGGYANTFKAIKQEHAFYSSLTKNFNFHAAVKKGEIGVVKRLLKDKQINIDSNINVSISRAMESGQSEVINLLLNHKRVELVIDHNKIINEIQGNTYKASYSEIAHKHALPQFTATVQAMSSRAASSFPNELITHQLINFHPELVDTLFLTKTPEEKQVAVAELVHKTIQNNQELKNGISRNCLFVE